VSDEVIGAPDTDDAGNSRAASVRAARLNRRDLGATASEVRILHLGLGAFHRAHQAWYTNVVNHLHDNQWGISAFTGRRPDEAEKLAPQDGLFTLITRSPLDDSAEIVSSISEVHTASDVDAWLLGFGNPRVTVVTITITEAGYCRDQDGGLDFDAPGVAVDVAALRAGERTARATAPGKLVQGLMERRRLGLDPLAIVSCDNLPGNGSVTRRVVLDLCSAVDTALADWVASAVRFPNTMVDRITPRATEDDIALATELTGWRDQSPVVTEPFREWVIERDFANERPEWERAGALLVDDVVPHERRKLLLLNGAHSLLAYVGLAGELTTVAEAISDAKCRALVAQWWGEARELVEFDSEVIDEYCSSLLERWANPRIAHRLEQIATDGSLKLPLRAMPVIREFRETGRLPSAAISAVAGWMVHLRRGPLTGPDAALASLEAESAEEAAASALRILAPDLENDLELRQAVAAAFDHLLAQTSTR
jgi:fructuronate reductase